MSGTVGEATLGGTNLELKARVSSLAALRGRLRGLGAELEGVERQEDRYFRAPHGRLKLRVSSRDGAHLVAYRRPEEGLFRESLFHRVPVIDHDRLATVLAAGLGTGPRVVKTREVWWWRGVRIHLDDVEERGTFVELEARVDAIGDRDETIARLERLCQALAIAPDEALGGSYEEMACRPTI